MSRGSPGGIQAGQAVIQLSLNDKEFRKNLHGARTYLNRWADMLTKVGSTMSLAGGAMLGAFAMITKQVANLESAFRRFDLMFGNMAGAMTSELQKVSDATGMPMTALKQHAAAFGAIFAEMREEITDEQYVQLVGKTMQSVVDLVGLAGISMEEAADRIKSGFTSTGEALDQFGINLRKANIEAEAQRLGIKGTVLTMTEQQKQLIKLSIMLRQTARTGITFAAVGDTINAQLTLLVENIKELMGRMVGFLNMAVVPVLKGFNLLLRVLRPLAILLGPIVTMFGVLGGTLLAIGGLVLSVGLLGKVTTIAIAGWLELTRLIKDFTKFYAVVKASMAATGSIDLATAAWGRLAGVIALTNKLLKASGLSAALSWASQLLAKLMAAVGGFGGLMRLLGTRILPMVGGAWALHRLTTRERQEGRWEPGMTQMVPRLRPGMQEAIDRDQLRIEKDKAREKFIEGLEAQVAEDRKKFPKSKWGIWETVGSMRINDWMRKRLNDWERNSTPGAAAVGARAAAFVGTAGTFLPGVAQQLAFGAAGGGTERTNAILGDLQSIARQVVSDKHVNVNVDLL